MSLIIVSYRLYLYLILIEIIIDVEFTYIGCQKTYDKPDGRILFSDDDTAREEECVFTISLAQSNLTISLYISSFRFSGPAISNYLKVTRY